MFGFGSENMSWSETVSLWIALVVLIVMIRVYQLITFGAPDDVGFTNIPPKKITRKIFSIISHYLSYIFVYILVVITFLWILYHILLRITIFNIGMKIIKKVPPFRQLRSAGIFRLWDDVSVSFYRLDIKGFIMGFVRFYYTAGRYVFNSFAAPYKRKAKAMVLDDKDGGKAPPPAAPVVVKDEGAKTGQKPAVVDSKPLPTTEYVYGAYTDYTTSQDNTTTEKQPEEKPTTLTNISTVDEKTLTTDDNDATDDAAMTAQEHKNTMIKTSMCIAESTLPIDTNASFIDSLKARVNNSKGEIMCNALMVADSTKELQK